MDWMPAFGAGCVEMRRRRPDELERVQIREDLFLGSGVRIGTFRARPSHPRFHDSGPIRRHVFVFPHRAVWIEHAAASGFVADQNVVTFYNRGQVYRREAIDPQGDDCVWIAPDPASLVSVLRGFDLPTADGEPFAWNRSLADGDTYLLHSALLRYLQEEAEVDELMIEETAFELLGRLLVCRRRKKEIRATSSACHQREVAEWTRKLINLRFAESLSVAEIADQIGYSPFHLSRVFRKQVGLSIHAYRAQIRLRTALLWLEDVDDLTALALDLGFSSHSHLTTAFTAAFGMPPSEVRRRWSRRRLSELSRRLHHSCRAELSRRPA